MQQDEIENEEYVHDHGNDKFFAIIGSVLSLFGACIALFDIMHSPVLSGIAALLFLLVGGTCLMVAAGGFLKYLDEKYL